MTPMQIQLQYAFIYTKCTVRLGQVYLLLVNIALGQLGSWFKARSDGLRKTQWDREFSNSLRFSHA